MADAPGESTEQKNEPPKPAEPPPAKRPEKDADAYSALSQRISRVEERVKPKESPETDEAAEKLGAVEWALMVGVGALFFLSVLIAGLRWLFSKKGNG